MNSSIQVSEHKSSKKNKKPFKVIDLTHTITPNIPTWDCTYSVEIINTVDYKDNPPEWPFRTQHFKIRAGVGTHIDAPSHCFEGANSVHQISLDDLIVPGVMIDISKKATETYSLTVDDIKEFEAAHGEIPEESLVIVYTGWEKYWGEPSKYHNDYVFPSVTGEAAEFLLKRNVSGLGIDTLSADRKREGFPVHRSFLGAGKYLVENVANLASLPPTGFYAGTIPIKVKDATEVPVRLIALIFQDQ